MYTIFMQDEVQQHVDPVTSLVHFDIVKKIHQEKFSPSMLFSTINTNYSLDKMLVEEFHMIKPQKHVVCEELTWKKNDQTQNLSDLINVERYAYVVPLLKSLTVLLSNDEVRLNIQNPKAQVDGVLKSILDGSHYHENEFFRNNKKCLSHKFLL